jgi:hypothetical protein
MSNTYRLIDDGFPTYKKIVTGRKQIGTVRKLPDGKFAGIIGKTSFVSVDEITAYNEVVARYCGYANYAAMRSRNAAARVIANERRQHAEYVATEAISGNFKPLKQLLKRFTE